MNKKSKSLVAWLCLSFFMLNSLPAWAQDGMDVVYGSSIMSLYTDNGGFGLMLEPYNPPEDDILNLKSGDRFVLTAATVKSSSAMYGTMAVGVVRPTGADQAQVVDIVGKRVLNGDKNMGLAYIECKVNEGVEILPGDEIWLLTYTDGQYGYKKVGTSYPDRVTATLPATGYKLPVFRVDYPEVVEGVTIESSESNFWTHKVAKGRNFYLHITPDDPETVVIVKANGASMPTVDTNVYALKGVMQDYTIEIIAYPKGTIYPYKEIECTEELRVKDILTQTELDCLKGLRVTGKVANEDFEVFRVGMHSLEILDLSDAELEGYIPEGAFEYNETIREIKVPKNAGGFASNAFRFMKKLEFMVLPPSLNVFGYNQFFSSSIKTVWVKWNPIEAGMQPPQGFPIPPCAFRATTIASEGLLVVPKGCVSIYKYTSYWGDFKTIREEKPIDRIKMEKPFSDYLKGVGIESATEAHGGFELYASSGECRILTDGIEPQKVEIYGADGRLCEELMTQGSCTVVALRPGFYVVRMMGEGRKILVP